MRYVFSPEVRPVLERLGRERTLCAFDFDGTLAPIVERPGEAAMRARTREALARLSDRFPCVVLSGRARADVLARLEGVKLERVLGNHGAEAGDEETGVEEQSRRRRIEEWKQAIEGELSAVPGLWVEDKGHSLAIHYRQCPQKAEARRRILEAAGKLRGVSIVGGKQVVNLVEPGAANKGVALAGERDRLQCDWVLFVGDDENDEDAFGIGGNLVGVRVGRKKNSLARYYVRNQNEVDKLLERIAVLPRR